MIKISTKNWTTENDDLQAIDSTLPHAEALKGQCQKEMELCHPLTNWGCVENVSHPYPKRQIPASNQFNVHNRDGVDFQVRKSYMSMKSRFQ